MNDEGYSSDWHTDVVLYDDEMSLSVGTGTSNHQLISHGLGYEPVYAAQYKVNSFWHEPGVFPFTPPSSPGHDDVNGVACHIEVTTSELRVYFNNTSGSTRTVTVRYWVYENRLLETING